MARTSMERNRVTGLVQRSELGDWEVPVPILLAIAKEESLRAAMVETSRRLGDRPDLLGELTKAVTDAGTVPPAFTQRIGALYTEHEALNRQANLLTMAVEQAQERVVGAAGGHADEIITEQLRPALEEVLSVVREHAPAAGSIPWDDFDKAMEAPEPEREAYLAIREAQKRYTALRAAQEICYWLTVGENDGTRKFSEIRNFEEVWPSHAFRQPGNVPPWPTNPMARLVWLVTSGAEPWMPTFEEIESEWTVRRAAAMSPDTSDGTAFLPR